jgi:hypothetical protein
MTSASTIMGPDSPEDGHACNGFVRKKQRAALKIDIDGNPHELNASQ